MAKDAEYGSFIAKMNDPERKVRKKAHIRNRYNQIPHLTNDTIWESKKKTQENITHKRAKKSAFFPTGDHKATRNRQDSMAELQKGSTKEVPPWNGQ